MEHRDVQKHVEELLLAAKTIKEVGNMFLMESVERIRTQQEKSRKKGN